MIELRRVRRLKWGNDHLVLFAANKKGVTLCKLKVGPERDFKPNGDRICVDCRRRAKEMGYTRADCYAAEAL